MSNSLSGTWMWMLVTQIKLSRNGNGIQSPYFPKIISQVGF
jgi:hypothetical protein